MVPNNEWKGSARFANGTRLTWTSLSRVLTCCWSVELGLSNVPDIWEPWCKTPYGWHASADLKWVLQESGLS